MYLRLSPDEESIKDIFDSFFDAECSIERVRNAEESGFDATAWERFIGNRWTRDVPSGELRGWRR